MQHSPFVGLTSHFKDKNCKSIAKSEKINLKILIKELLFYTFAKADYVFHWLHIISSNTTYSGWDQSASFMINDKIIAIQ